MAQLHNGTTCGKQRMIFLVNRGWTAQLESTAGLNYYITILTPSFTVSLRIERLTLPSKLYCSWSSAVRANPC